VLKRCYLLEKNYLNNYLESSPTESKKQFLCKRDETPPGFEQVEELSPKSKEMLPISEEEEEEPDPKVLKISGFSSKNFIFWYKG
jgi:hypothetical protein